MFKKLWAGELFQSGTGAGRTAGIQNGQCGRFAADLCAAYEQAAQSGRPDGPILDLLKASSPASVLAKITAPTLLTQGEKDSLFPLTEADANAKGIAANGTKVKVMWRAGGHDGGTDQGELNTDLLGWFDPVLQHKGSTNSTFDLTQTGASISSETGEKIAQTLQVGKGYPGIDGHASQQFSATVTGSAQTINAPAGGNPAAVTAVRAWAACSTPPRHSRDSPAPRPPASPASPGRRPPSSPPRSRPADSLRAPRP